MAKVIDPERYAGVPGWVRVVDDFGNHRCYHFVEDVRDHFRREATPEEKDNIEITLDWLMERVKEDEDTGCWVWQRFITKQGQPQCRIAVTPFVHATMLVRRLVARMKFEPSAKFPNASRFMRNRQAGVNPTCSWGCVHPDHVKMRSKKQAMAFYKGTPMPLTQKMRISQTKRAKSKVKPEDIHYILASTEPANKVSIELGMSESYASKVRRGKIGVVAATGVFTGLLAPANGEFYRHDEEEAA